MVYSVGIPLSTTQFAPTQKAQEEKPESTAFSDKRFKLIRVAGTVISSAFLALVYKVVSLANQLFRRHAAKEKYGQLASYHLDKAGSRACAYWEYGGHIINFATNCPADPKTWKIGKTNEVKALEKLYGKDFKEQRKMAETAKFPIDEDQLSRRKGTRGICLGESMEFLHRFLDLHGTDGKYSKHIKKVSSLYSDGGTKQATLTQIWHTAQDQTWRWDQELNFIKQLDQEMNTQAKKQNKEKEQNLRVEQQLRTKKAELRAKMLEPLAAINKLTLELAKVIDPRDEQRDAIDTIPRGAHLVVITDSGNHTAHAIAYIKKSNDKGYLFDPSFATIKMKNRDEQHKYLENIMDDYITTENSAMAIYQCTPLTSE